MYSTPFSENAIKSVTRAGDSARYNVNVRDDINIIAAEVSAEVSSGVLNFSHRVIPTKDSREIYLLNNYKTVLALRATAKAIASEYKISPLGRDTIVRGVLESLFDATPTNVIRSDFASFYENVDVSPIIEMIKSSTRTHPYVNLILEQLQSANILKSNVSGIPRGLGLSAVLSEIRLKKFDEDVRCIEGVYRYFRFADDMLVFSIGNPETTIDKIKSISGKDLLFNPVKTKYYKIPSLHDTVKDPCKEPPVQLDFLGYKFIISCGVRTKRSRSIRVTLSENKIAKRKTRAILALKDFESTKDADLLIRRLRLLTSNMSIRRTGHSHGSRKTRVNTGIFYNYRACGTYECANNRPTIMNGRSIRELKELDGFMYSLLWRASSSFSGSIATHLSNQQKEKLLKCSFSSGFDHKITIRLTRSEAAHARRIWRNA